MRPAKEPGQADYEAELTRKPTYHDGRPRPTWAQLSDVARWSWARPTMPESTDKLRDQIANAGDC